MFKTSCMNTPIRYIFSPCPFSSFVEMISVEEWKPLISFVTYQRQIFIWSKESELRFSLILLPFRRYEVIMLSIEVRYCFRVKFSSNITHKLIAKSLSQTTLGETDRTMQFYVASFPFTDRNKPGLRWYHRVGLKLLEVFSENFIQMLLPEKRQVVFILIKHYITGFECQSVQNYTN